MLHDEPQRATAVRLITHQLCTGAPTRGSMFFEQPRQLAAQRCDASALRSRDPSPVPPSHVDRRSEIAWALHTDFSLRRAILGPWYCPPHTNPPRPPVANQAPARSAWRPPCRSASAAWSAPASSRSSAWSRRRPATPCGSPSPSAAWWRCCRPIPTPSSARPFPSAGGAVHFLVKSFGDGVLAGGLNLFMWAGYIISLALYATAFGSYAATFITDDAFAAAGQIAGGRLGAAADAGQCVRRQDHGARRNDHRRRQGGDPGAVRRPRACGSSSPSNLSPALWPETQSILFGAGVLFIGYEGFGLVTNAAADMRNPRTMLPRALYTSVILVIVIYLAVVGDGDRQSVQCARSSAPGTTRWPKPPSRSWASSASGLIAIAALFSTASAINATLFGSANVCYMIARDGELPAGLSRTEWKQATGGLLLTAALVDPGDALLRSVRHRHDGQRRVPAGLCRGERRPSARAEADRRERHDRLAVAHHLPRHVRDARRLHLPAAAGGDRRRSSSSRQPRSLPNGPTGAGPGAASRLRLDKAQGITLDRPLRGKP